MSHVITVNFPLCLSTTCISVTCEGLHFAPLENVGTSGKRREGLISCPEYGSRDLITDEQTESSRSQWSVATHPVLPRTWAIRMYVNHCARASAFARNLADGSSYRDAFKEFHIVYSTEWNW